MGSRVELAIVEDQSAVAKPLISQAELESTDSIMQEMHDWCQRQQDIVVLNRDNLILASAPHSRSVQNCKVVMLNKGLQPGPVISASQHLIKTLLATLNTYSNAPQSTTQNALWQRLCLLIQDAVHHRASHIHLEIREEFALIRLRKFGILYFYAEWLPDLAQQITRELFKKQNNPSKTLFNPAIAQTILTKVAIDNQQINLQVASLPAHYGIDVLIQILPAEQSSLSLLTLGFTDQQIDLISKITQLPQALVLITGPSDSGKSTTLASCLSLIAAERKVISLEQSVSRIISNTTQVTFTETDATEFNKIMQAVLRINPDVLSCDEIPHHLAMDLLFNAILSQRSLFAALPVNSAMQAVVYLLEAGLKRRLLMHSDLPIYVINQRLIPILCRHCAIPLMASTKHKLRLMEWQALFGELTKQIYVRSHRPCQYCDNSGIIERRLSAEIITLDEVGRQYIQQDNLLAWHNYLKENHYLEGQAQVILAVLHGLCDPLDAEKLIGLLDKVDMNHIAKADVELKHAIDRDMLIMQPAINIKPVNIPSW